MTTSPVFSAVTSFVVKVFMASHVKATDLHNPESSVVSVVQNGQIVRFS